MPSSRGRGKTNANAGGRCGARSKPKPKSKPADRLSAKRARAAPPSSAGTTNAKPKARAAQGTGADDHTVDSAAYWDNLAKDYKNDVCVSWLDQSPDAHDAMAEALRGAASQDVLCVDFGTGPGFALPALAKKFGAVVGVDLSPKLVDMAARRVAGLGLENVRVFTADLSAGLSLRGAIAKNLKPGRLDEGMRCRFGTCANVLLSPSAATRRAILKTIQRTVDKGGQVLFVVPSLESKLFTDSLLRRWSSEDAAAEGLAGTRVAVPRPASQVRGGKKRRTDKRARPASRALAVQDLLEGVLPCGDTPTQHFLREQLAAELGDAGFEVQHISKVSYEHSSEFTSPPKWMLRPHISRPWDWTCLTRRV